MPPSPSETATKPPPALSKPERTVCLESIASRIAIKADTEWHSFDYIMKGGTAVCPRCEEPKALLPPVAKRHLESCFGEGIFEDFVAATGGLWQVCDADTCHASRIDRPNALKDIPINGHFHTAMQCPWGVCFLQYLAPEELARHFGACHLLAECRVRLPTGECDWKYQGKALPKLTNAVARSKAMKDYQCARDTAMAEHLEVDHAMVCYPEGDAKPQVTLCRQCNSWLVGYGMKKEHAHRA